MAKAAAVDFSEQEAQSAELTSVDDGMEVHVGDEDELEATVTEIAKKTEDQGKVQIFQGHEVQAQTVKLLGTKEIEVGEHQPKIDQFVQLVCEAKVESVAYKANKDGLMEEITTLKVLTGSIEGYGDGPSD